jgi:flavin-dependent dehydrogenase
MKSKVDLDVVIAGAGPAGAAAACRLAQAGFAVLLCEAGTLPRHRLCGEFVSPEALADLDALGLDLSTCGVQRLGAARIATRGAAAAAPFVAFALERRVLDAWLVDQALAAGARLRTATRVEDVRGTPEEGFAVTVRAAPGTPEVVRARWVIGAFGRQPRRLRPASERPGRRGRIAVKSHWTGVAMPAQVELHAVAGGYVGLVPVGRDRINVCAVVRAECVREARGGGAVRLLERLLDQAPQAAARCALGVEDEAARCAESGLHFGIARPVWRDILLCGDAAVVPHPFSGDGIAMALRAGRLAAAHIEAALAGRLASHKVAGLYARAWRREFASRLRWDRPLHAALEHRHATTTLLRLLARWPRGLTALVAHTRGAGDSTRFLEVET